ncbi:MAG: hypothetical protein IJV35_06545 [Neisseriaceae bacterium]|nr:hypothetical protein [Neisseriaceae bacterium]
MIKSSLIRLDYFVLDNTSILLSGCLKPQSKRYLKNNPFCRKAKQNNCSLLIAHC